ncbi:hypothetical protein EVAR_36853_1 [Eumeta japonica]|uniref:Uncharacterized protein n=1 Tax=Eumeta variegata TaxID=151549 RepID=A0A4C1WSZ6_EUMVA|nr:hypothetical protein EVAR_36853_1 [Eumeta japonica]
MFELNINESPRGRPMTAVSGSWAVIETVTHIDSMRRRCVIPETVRSGATPSAVRLPRNDIEHTMKSYLLRSMKRESLGNFMTCLTPISSSAEREPRIRQGKIVSPFIIRSFNQERRPAEAARRERPRHVGDAAAFAAALIVRKICSRHLVDAHLPFRGNT